MQKVRRICNKIQDSCFVLIFIQQMEFIVQKKNRTNLPSKKFVFTMNNFNIQNINWCFIC